MPWISQLDCEQDEQLLFETLRPTDSLRPLVRFYWILKCSSRAPKVPEFLAADGFEEIIFSYGGGYKRQVGRDGQSATINGSYLVASKDAGLYCLRESTLSMVGVKLQPQGLNVILGNAFDPPFNRPVPLNCFPATQFDHMEERVFNARGPAEIKAVLDASLSRLLAERRSDKLVEHTVNTIFGSGGNIRIDRLIQQIGVHHRTLEKRFKQELGLSPKHLARTVRFKNIFHAISNAGRYRPGQLDLYAFGFYDDSHFSREFRHFTGKSPREFFKYSSDVSTDVFDVSQRADRGISAQQQAQPDYQSLPLPVPA